MLVDGSTPGNDMRYIEKKVEAARNLPNKLWNATRFVLMNLPEDFVPVCPLRIKLDMSDKWVLNHLNQVAGAMTDNLDHYEMGLAAAKINSFIWDVYCDWFIEIAKPRLNSGDPVQADTARRVLVYVLDKAPEAAASLYAVYYRGAVSGSARLCRDHYDPGLAHRGPDP